MPSEELTVLSLTDAPGDFAAAIGASFREYGFAVVGNHGIDPALIADAWRVTTEFFALPEAEKRVHVLEGTGGARGYTPLGVKRRANGTPYRR